MRAWWAFLPVVWEDNIYSETFIVFVRIDHDLKDEMYALDVDQTACRLRKQHGRVSRRCDVSRVDVTSVASVHDAFVIVIEYFHYMNSKRKYSTLCGVSVIQTKIKQ